uniref:Uncharacterized protein n=1 Tax=Plectus sambesii TaxID=2011161 RepID=A0A914XFK6_9BILA
MGNGLVRFQSQSQVQQQYIINRSIERDLEVEAKKKPIKLLLLGAGESGKSTVLKQMKIIHDNGFTLEERRQRKTVILNYTVRNTFDMLAAMKVMNIKLDSAELLGAADCICKYISSCEIATSLPDRLFHAMQLLWAYEGVRKAYSRRSEFQLEDTAKYFLDALDRLRKPDYVPTERDILMIRVPTCGVVEVSFPCKNQCFRVFDVGGQRSERKKWIHCFDDVDAIIFITS